MGFVHASGNTHKPQEMEGSLAQQTFPHTWGHGVGSFCISCPSAAAAGLCVTSSSQLCRVSRLKQTPLVWSVALCLLSHPVLLLAIVAVWHVSSVGVTVCRWPCLGVWCGGQEPVANGTYCCIAGARLSGSLPAVWLKGFVWHFRGSLSYPSCLTLGLWSMSVSIWWVAERQPHEPLLNLPLLLISLDWRWQFIPTADILPVPSAPHKGTLQVTLETGRFIFEVVHGELQWPTAAVEQFIFHYFPRTTLKIHLCQTELRAEGCKLESGVVETAHTW